MATERLNYGKISYLNLFATGSNSFIRITGDFTSGSPTITNIADVGGDYEGISHILKGQKLISSGNTDGTATITNIDTGTGTITLDENAIANNTSALIRISPPKGQYFVESGSLTTLTNSGFKLNDITGSEDANYDGSDRKYGLVLQMAKTSSVSTGIQDQYGQYSITKIFQQDQSSNLISFYITSSTDGLEGEKNDLQPTTGLGYGLITELSYSQSLGSTLFASNLGMLGGFSDAAYQIAVPNTFDEFDFEGFPFTGSAGITGSLSVTGSNVFKTDVGGTDFFVIKSGSLENFKFNGEGVAQFHSHPNSYTPTAVLGGIYFTSQSAFVGLNE